MVIMSYINMFFVITLLLFVNAQAKDVEYTFSINYMSGWVDGVFKKESILAVNNQFPGPLIEAMVGDRVIVNVQNNIQDGQNTTIHWHGIHQLGTPFEDGASLITQCPCRSGHFQRYEFTVHTAGTFWYHSHEKSQYSEGLWGPLIVRSIQEAYKYDDEIILSLSDWYHRTAKENEKWHISVDSLGVPPFPDSALINGFGRYPKKYADLQNRTFKEEHQKRQVFKVKPKRVYRIRVINTSAESVFNFTIDGHQLEAIEVDGVDVASYSASIVDVALVAPGQRYSFLVRMDQNISRYLIRAYLNTDMLMLINDNVWFRLNECGKEIVVHRSNINKYPLDALMNPVTAVLEYSNDVDSFGDDDTILTATTESFNYMQELPDRDFTSPDLRLLDENYSLSPRDGRMSPSYFDKEIFLDIDFRYYNENEGDDGRVRCIRRGSFNGTPFSLPDDTPLIMNWLKLKPLPSEARSITINHGDVVQIVMNNPSFGPHPFHLHGYDFWVLGTGGKGEGKYDSEKHKLNLRGTRRDTVLVQEGSWAVIRFRAENPGVWLFHCHMDWHLLSGMAMTFVVLPPPGADYLTMTAEASRLCNRDDGFAIGRYIPIAIIIAILVIFSIIMAWKCINKCRGNRGGYVSVS